MHAESRVFPADIIEILLGMLRFLSQEEMYEFFQNHFVQWICICIIVINTISYGIITYNITASNPFIYFRYNAYIGADLSSVVPWKDAFILPAAVLICAFLHIFSAFLCFQKKERIVAHLLLFSAVIVEVSALIASISVVLVNSP